MTAVSVATFGLTSFAVGILVACLPRPTSECKGLLSFAMATLIISFIMLIAEAI